MKPALIILILLISNLFLYPQEKSVAVTMDDLFLAYGNLDIKGIETSNNALLNSITQLNIPVTVFINAKSFKTYQSKDYYYGHYGFSWIYRWIENTEKRKTLMRKDLI
jgi:hypothetical protein